MAASEYTAAGLRWGIGVAARLLVQEECLSPIEFRVPLCRDLVKRRPWRIGRRGCPGPGRQRAHGLCFPIFGPFFMGFLVGPLSLELGETGLLTV